jgi:hypothetical protein
VPRFEPPAADDPDNDTPERKRMGPFVLAQAFETPVPPGWLASAAEKPERVRVVAIGHPAFVGKELTPGQERLLLDSCNWLLGREDRLAHPTAVWQYPRVELSEKAEAGWMWACRLGLPLLFAYLGLVVLLARRLR